MTETSGKHGYRVVDEGNAGFGIRSITSVTDAEGNRSLVTINVADASMSRIPICDGKLGTQQVVQFPPQTRPIGLATIDVAGCTHYLLNCFFNYDEAGTSFVAATDDLDRLFALESVSDVEDAMQIVLRREAEWGFREVDAWQDNEGRHHIAATDLGQSRFHLLTDVLRGHTLGGEHRALDLGVDGEPVGLGRWHPMDDPTRPVFYMTLRKAHEMSVVRQDTQGNLAVVQRYPVDALARSSVAIGHFRAPDVTDLAIAFWGLDPMADIDKPVENRFMAASLQDDGLLADDALYTDAGVNPTDIVAVDLDGDGLDEIVVLNFGASAGEANRIHPGNVQIFKWDGGAFRCAATLDLPEPRFGYVLDIDGDGIDELIISLFFERKLVVIKHA